MSQTARKLSRRYVLKAGAATLAAAGLGIPFEARSSTTGIIPIVIRWDAWYADTGHAHEAQITLSPALWQGRAPWFSEQVSPSEIRSVGNQASMDMECQLAYQAGIKCFAFDWYGALDAVQGGPGDPPMAVSFPLYQASPYNKLVNWCGIIGLAYLGCPAPWSTNNWQPAGRQWASRMRQPTYQRLSDGRPILFILWYEAHVKNSFGGSLNNVAEALTYLRESCSAAGLPNPYIVIMAGPVNSSYPILRAIGADAISNYVPGHSFTSTPDTYADLDLSSRKFWSALAATGAEIIPDCITGWDNRPRLEHPESWSNFGPNPDLKKYFSSGSPSQIAAHIQAGVDFIRANPRSCPAKALLIYSWTECSEGGSCLIPTIADPPVNKVPGLTMPTSHLLAGIGPTLRRASEFVGGQ